MNKKTIVTILVEQHRTLQKGLKAVSGLLESVDIDTQDIIFSLNQFKQDLIDHLELENGTFYPELLKKMQAKGQDTEKTEQFIYEMKDIEARVKTFLGKYESVESVETKKDQFKKEFEKNVEILNIRIASEEATVYSYWALF